MIRWTGYAVSETAAIVRPFASCHRTRSQAVAAVTDSIESVYGGGSVSAVYAYKADTPEGEGYEEAAELAARDAVTGCDGLDEGYTLEAVEYLEPAERRRSVIAEAAAVSSMDRKALRALWRSYTAAGYDDGDEARAGFMALVERMEAYRC